MKRYIFSLVAAIVAISAVAFTAPKEHSTSKSKLIPVPFVYNPPTAGDYSHPSVTNKTRWSQGSLSCDGDDDKACQFSAESTQLNMDGTLGTNVTIEAEEGNDSGDYYVSGGDFLSSIVNRD